MRPNYFNKPITKRFIDAFPKFKKDPDDTSSTYYFWETWQNSPFYDSNLSETDLESVYYHLLAAYYTHHFVYMDDLGIALNVMHVIHDYYPNCKERLSLVEQLRNLTLAEFEKSSINIESQGSNPKIATDMDKLIDLVDSQNASFQIKSTEQTIRAKFVSLYDGVMDDFVDKFKYMFVKLYNGVNNYIYVNEIEEEDEE